MTEQKYQRVLLAIDFFEGNEGVVQRAVDMVERYAAELFVIHVNEPATPAYAADIATWGSQVFEINEQVRAYKKKRLDELAGELGLDEQHTVLAEGRPARSIHQFCDDQNIDLVVIGTHGQHGLGLLLGSTANSVLHGSSCDVLAVRIGAD
jgi:universal stress protein A